MHTICVLFLLLLVKLHHSSGRECVIEGIPGVSTSDNSNIHTILVPSSETSITLELTCKCSLYIPQWHTKTLEEDDGQFFVHPIHCINGTRPCSPNLNYIPESNKSQGLFVYLRKNFTMTENTALMCFSNIDREALIVSFSKDDDEGSSAILTTPSVLTRTVTETKTTTATSSITSTITRTSTTSMCSSKSKPIRVSSQDNTPSKSIISTRSEANTISTTSSVAVTQTPNIGDTNGIIESVGGPTLLVLIVLVLILIIISIGLCGVIICMKTRNKQREVQELTSESNSTDTKRLSDMPLLWRNSNASEIGELGTHMPRSFSTPIRSLSTNNNNTRSSNDDFRITVHYMTDTSSPVNQPVNGDDEMYPNPDAENCMKN